MMLLLLYFIAGLVPLLESAFVFVLIIINGRSESVGVVKLYICEY